MSVVKTMRVYRLVALVMCLVVPLIGFADQEGMASYYADALAGNPTASGEPYDPELFTAAHRALAFDTRVKVTYLATGKSVEVVINDRGPYADDRIIDLSRAAAEAIGLVDDGVGEVLIEAR